MTAGLLDTSVFIARETRRRLDADALPEQSYVSVITLAELAAGVHAARDAPTRARRLDTLQSLAALQALPVDDRAAQSWAMLRVGLRDLGRSVKVNDLWIAAIAHANNLSVVTQDDDFEPLQSLGLAIIKV